MSVCFIAGTIVKALQVSAFTLAWTHSVEKTDWQEDWRVTRNGLMLVEARVKGSGAGIDPPAHARLVDGWWRWRPPTVSRSEVTLANSGAVPDWRICVGGRCAPLHATIGLAAGTGPVVMQRCPENAS
ncbi:DUF1850 domain-containing protein [Bradyrhizobium sp. LHD-71]|uniref:DUF1850 domain-containing protein n=1 Tax=Bradyrhizobium sp. LHD-71 TaxID=3072141 RepID=UPI00280E3142|nr:DUF1850 domain-containing protein [Bradyrhizobium sp. LHD-71]MDQ8726704.1 DUF1850 domain-containing protein [Bradyrhizobium sp. LHD-71]